MWKYKNKVTTPRTRDPAYDLQWYYNNRERVLSNRKMSHRIKYDKWIAFKSTLKCAVCGENHPAVLEFHHTDPSKKEGNISYVYHSGRAETLMDEISKCEVLCSNHHKIHHFDEKMRVRILTDQSTGLQNRVDVSSTLTAPM